MCQRTQIQWNKRGNDRPHPLNYNLIFQTEEIKVQQKAGVLLFAQLRRLNRLSNLYCKDTREKTQEKKLSVDELHLQLQNLQYEAKHLQKEITSCLEFK